MKIYEQAVRKPVSTILIFIGVIVFGLFSLSKLAIDMYPEMEIPMISVITTYQGANAADIETNITKILEDKLNTVSNLKKITSRSSDNISLVQLQFEWGSDLTEASNDIRDAVSRVEQFLPDGADKPMIFKINSSMIPVMVLSITADESYAGLNKMLDNKLINPLNRLDGIGAVSMFGSPARQIQINVDPQKMEAYNLSVEQLGQIIAAENINMPAGSIDIGNKTLSIRSENEFASSDIVKNIPVANVNGREILISDIAIVKDTLEKSSIDERINTSKAVRVIIQKQSGANSVDIANRVAAMVPEIQATLPPDVKIDIVMDTSESIKDSISSLSDTIMYAFIFVMLVVLFFLGRWRATFIIIITIPVSLIVSFIYLYATGSTLNIISLSSLSIAIGMVVDDAIVVLENVTKHIERGSSPREASIYGTNEVWLAVIATTLTVVAVFLPLTMLGGMAGIMFRELGWIVSLVTVISTVAAVTLTPMLTSKMLTFDKEHAYKGLGILFKPIDKFLDRLDEGYGKLLTWSVRHRALVLISALLVFVSSLLLLSKVPTEFFPMTDNAHISATVELDQGAELEYTKKVARKLDSTFMAKYPELEIISASSGSASGSNAFAAMRKSGSNMINYMFRLPRRSERDRDIFELSDSMRKDISLIPEVKQYKVSPGGDQGGSIGGSDISLDIFGHDFEVADRVAREFKEKIIQVKGTRDVQLSRDEMRPEYRIKYDRNKLAKYSLNTATVSSAVYNRINGLTASKYREQGDEYDIVVRYDEQFRTSLEDIENILIYNPKGQSVRVKDVGEVIEEYAPPAIERENRQRIISVKSSISGAALGDVAGEIKKIVDQTELPEGIYVELGGAYEDQQESFSDMMLLLVLIIMLVYIVMATQFESFKMPFIIMLSLPFAFTGVFLALFMTSTPLSLIALIGAIMLVGIVVKNGIVMVDFTNLLRERGLTINQAVINSGKSRLRPVLMTSLTTILGMLPLALGIGEGSETWQPMGIAVIGGLTFSTMLTLVVIPVFYASFTITSVQKERKRLAKLVQEYE